MNFLHRHPLCLSLRSRIVPHVFLSKQISLLTIGKRNVKRCTNDWQVKVNVGYELELLNHDNCQSGSLFGGLWVRRTWYWSQICETIWKRAKEAQTYQNIQIRVVFQAKFTRNWFKNPELTFLVVIFQIFNFHLKADDNKCQFLNHILIVLNQV